MAIPSGAGDPETLMNAGTLLDAEALMDAAWPAAEREDTGWVLRAAAGVTQRANSVWPRSEPGTDGPARQATMRQAALRQARLWYRSRRLPLIFQVADDPRSAGLNALLDQEGFTRQSETLILVRGAEPAPPAAPADAGRAVEVTAEPTPEWLRLWWSVDGRGGDRELAVARGILTGCPSLYALVRDDDGDPAAVGRLALVQGRGGFYCMAARPDARRRGFGTRVTEALLRAGAARGLSGYWLLVTAANPGARSLYEQAGFIEAGRYTYRQDRPKRALTGC